MKNKIIYFAAALMLFVSAANATHLPLRSPAHSSNADEGVKIKLIIGGKTYDVLSYNLTFLASDRSKPNTEATGNLPYYNNTNSLNVNIKSTKIDPEFLDWILSADGDGKDGQILIVDSDSGKTLKTISFSVLKPLSYNENFYNPGALGSSLQPIISFSLHFSKISIKL